MVGARSSRRALLLGLLGAALAGCGAPWKLVRQAGPNPFPAAARRFALRPIALDGMRIVGRARDDYFAHEPPSAEARFEGDLSAMSGRLADALASDHSLPAEVEYVPAGEPPGEGFVIQPSLLDVDPGSYGGLLGRDAEVRMAVKIARPDGTVLDEIELRASAAASMESAAAGTRLRHCADALAADLSRYLRARLNGS